VLEESVAHTETRLLAYCMLRNHWHLVVWPRASRSAASLNPKGPRWSQ
jgi:hypothetical protein